MVSRIVEWFFEGLLFVVPLAVTCYVSYRIFVAIDGLIPNLPYPGLGVAITLTSITLLGGILGAIGGLIIVWPLYSIIGLVVLAAKLGLVDVLLYPLMPHRLWPRKHRNEIS